MDEATAASSGSTRILPRKGALKLLLVSFFTFSPLGIHAQQPLNLDMASVAILARTQSWTSKQAHQDAVTAGEDARRVASARWGQINFQSQYLRFNDPIHIESPIPSNLQPVLGLKSLATPLAPQDNLHVDLEAGYPVFAGGKIHNAIKATREASHASAEAANDTDDDVILTAERNYLSVLLMRQVVELDTAALQSYNEHLQHAQTSYRLGTAANYDVIRAEAAVAEQEKRLTEARNQLALAEAALRTSLALEDSASIDIGGRRIFERKGS